MKLCRMKYEMIFKSRGWNEDTYVLNVRKISQGRNLFSNFKSVWISHVVVLCSAEQHFTNMFERKARYCSSNIIIIKNKIWHPRHYHSMWQYADTFQRSLVHQQKSWNQGQAREWRTEIRLPAKFYSNHSSSPSSYFLDCEQGVERRNVGRFYVWS